MTLYVANHPEGWGKIGFTGLADPLARPRGQGLNIVGLLEGDQAAERAAQAYAEEQWGFTRIGLTDRFIEQFTEEHLEAIGRYLGDWPSLAEAARSRALWDEAREASDRWMDRDGRRRARTEAQRLRRPLPHDEQLCPLPTPPVKDFTAAVDTYRAAHRVSRAEVFRRVAEVTGNRPGGVALRYSKNLGPWWVGGGWGWGATVYAEDVVWEQRARTDESPERGTRG